MKWSSIHYLKFDLRKNPALILFSIASITNIVAWIYQIDLLILISKSLIVPSILLYYWQGCKEPENFVIFLFLIFFSADIVIVTKPENSLSWVICLHILSYIVILFSVIKTLREDSKELITKNKIYNIVGVVTVYLFIYFQFIDFIFALNFEYKSLYLVASLIILILAILTTITYFLKRTMKKTMLFIAVLMMICSGFIYVCQIYYVEMESLYLWSLITKSIFYFFLINYYLINNKKETAI